ncbi:hypothetical protein [Treponema sp. J25]|uniref:hypothetical protein n=1 Tax=Treponema sp. J25 TaxID=2094121 RepID=UPI0010429076|nr:hypothetical protein [Treponema sp. J25]TCW60228.1 hypothetical protein C5O22_12680 [Treponema sp. J25]
MQRGAFVLGAAMFLCLVGCTTFYGAGQLGYDMVPVPPIHLSDEKDASQTEFHGLFKVSGINSLLYTEDFSWMAQGGFLYIPKTPLLDGGVVILYPGALTAWSGMAVCNHSPSGVPIENLIPGRYMFYGGSFQQGLYIMMSSGTNTYVRSGIQLQGAYETGPYREFRRTISQNNPLNSEFYSFIDISSSPWSVTVLLDLLGYQYSQGDKSFMVTASMAFHWPSVFSVKDLMNDGGFRTAGLTGMYRKDRATFFVSFNSLALLNMGVTMGVMYQLH